ncbi:MAG: hypothetical protein LBB23_01230 [Rickettsiales bacterium]|nr:hypothetical protein [Rickettsiales bacterium]
MTTTPAAKPTDGFASEGDFVRLTSTNHPAPTAHPSTLEGNLLIKRA